MVKIESKDIVLVDINKIIPNPKNTNKHSKEQIEKLEELIRHNGFRDPLIISNRSGFLICGHGRLEAAKNLKMDKVPVIYQNFKNEAEEFQFMTAHNAIARWAELDNDLILEGIKEFNIDSKLLAIEGFEMADIETNNNVEPIQDEQKFLIIIECKDEIEQQDFFSEFQSREIICKIMS